jgi:hypothetical protein
MRSRLENFPCRCPGCANKQLSSFHVALAAALLVSDSSCRSPEVIYHSYQLFNALIEFSGELSVNQVSDEPFFENRNS